MKIQSLSIAVPTNDDCCCHCPFCISRTHAYDYTNFMDENSADYHVHLNQYLKSLQHAKDNGCTNVILTGTGEPQQNKNFLTMFGMMMKLTPFSDIALQTTGVYLNGLAMEFLRDHVGVSTISLSIATLEKYKHFKLISAPLTEELDIEHLSLLVKSFYMKLRLSINLTKSIENQYPDYDILLEDCRKIYSADQITFRVLKGTGDSPQAQWVKENKASNRYVQELGEFLSDYGRPLPSLDYGATPLAINDMSVVLDDDCQDERIGDDIRYLILRPDCHLYSKWDDRGSIVF